MTDDEIEEIENQIKDEGGGEMGADDGDFYAQNDPTQGDK